MAPHKKSHFETASLAEIKQIDLNNSTELKNAASNEDKITLTTIRCLVDSYFRLELAKQMCSEDGIEEKVKQLNFCNRSAL